MISAFKQKKAPKINPKLAEALKKKFYNFDGNRVLPSFSHNVFWLNHLNPNFSVSPRYTSEIITNYITYIIPGETRIIPGREYTIPGETRIIPGREYTVPGETHIIPGREYTIPGGTHIEYVPRTETITTIVPGGIIGTERVLDYTIPGTTYTEYGNWGNWSPPISSGAEIDIPGNKTMVGWAELYRGNYLQSKNPNLTNKQANDQAKIDLAPCFGGSGRCNVQIEIPPNADISGGQACTSGGASECKGGLFITGSFKEGQGGGPGEWKPEFDYMNETRNREEIIKNTDPVDVYKEVPVYGPDTEKTEEVTVLDPVEIKDPDTVVKEPDTVVKDPDKVVKEEDTVEKDPDKVVKEEDTVEKDPDKEVVEERQEERVKRAKSEWKFSFAPAYFFDYDFGKMVLNQNDGSGGRFIQSIKEPNRKKLSRKISSEEDQDVSLYYGKSPRQDYQQTIQSARQAYQQTLQTSAHQQMQQTGLPPADIVGDTEGPFIVKKFFTITAGLGGTASANYTNAGVLSQLGLSVALLPALGGGAHSILIFDSFEAAEKAKHLNIPRSAEDIMNWRDGDTLQYEVHGGVVFSGGVGFYGLAAGVSFLAQGFWQRTFSKIDAKTVLAKLERNKIFSFGVYGAAGLAGLSLDKFIAKENALTFAIDIGTRRGKDLLVDFMKGDMRKLQKAAANEKDMAVLSGMKIKGKTKGRSFSFGIGVPYLPASARWNKANFLNESHTDFIGANRKKDNTLHAEVFSFKGKFFPLFKNTSQGFFSNVTQSSGVVPTFLQSYKTGQYAFNFQRSYADKKDLEEVLKSLLKKTGLIGLLDVKIASNVNKVGSAEIKFAVKFKTAATNLLMAQVTNKNLKIFDQIGQGFISSYFNSLNHKRDDSLELCPARTLKKCEERMRQESMKAFLAMKKALIEMNSLDSKTLKSRERLARAYSKFGDAMMENPFTLQTVLAMTLGQGADVYLSVETSKTKKYESILRALPNNPGK